MKTLETLQYEADGYVLSWINGNLSTVINEIVNLPVEQAMFHIAYMAKELETHQEVDGLMRYLRAEALNST